MKFVSLGGRAGLPLLLLGAAVLAASGCGPGKGSVSGSVTYNNAPLPSGSISFVGQDGDKAVLHSDIKNGKYEIKEIPSGTYKVTVETMPPSVGGQPPNGPAISGPSAPAPAGPFVPIDKKFADPDKSGLSYEVKSGPQTKDFPLVGM